MVQQLSKIDSTTDIIYPDCDGQPMADNTEQFQWIVNIKENLEAIYKDDPNVFVAGDLLWYPIEGDNKTRQAPDTMVALGRPKGYRGSYMQWKEDGIAPQVVFEILSPGNRMGEMFKKFHFYQRHGVQEYYVYDPYDIELMGWQLMNQRLEIIEGIEDWTSPLLQIRFVVKPDTLEIYGPDGKPFLSLADTQQKLDESEARNTRLTEKLKELGIDPSEI